MSKTDTATIREVYEISQRLESKLDENLSKHDERIRSLEDSRANINGRVSVLSFLVSVVVSIGIALIQYFSVIPR